MNMHTYYVKFNVDGRPGGEIVVEARDISAAKRVAMAELQGRAGYAGRRIVITSTIKQ